MGFMDALQTSASGLSAQRLRMNLIANNLANINTTKTPEGGPYRRKDVILSALPMQTTFHQMLEEESAGQMSEVHISGIVNDSRPPLLVYDPSHPDADEKGYLAKPNINLMEEMVNMISATRSYEANVAAAKASKDMALKALEIGR